MGARDADPPRSGWTGSSFARSDAPLSPALERTRPRYSAEDFAALFWRRRWLMLGVFLVLLALGALAAMTLKTSYAANSSLLVRLGQEYVYQPQVGDAGRGLAPQNDALIQSEVEILGSAALKDLVIRDIGITRLSPKAARDYARSGPDQRRAIEGAVIKAMESSLTITTAPDTAVVRLSYKDPDPQLAALVLNTLVDEYLTYRRQVLVSRDTRPLEDQRRLFEQKLAETDADYTRFLTQNGIGDFDAEKASLAQLYGQLLTDSYSVASQISETQGRLGVTARQAAGTPRETNLYRDLDHAAFDRLAALKVELQDLRARYKPGAQPLADKEAQVAAMAQLAQATAGDTAARRLGANPVFQTAQTERNTLEAQLASLRSRKSADDAQTARVLARRQRLAALEPTYQELTRQRDLLSANVRNFTAREQENQADSALAAGGGGSIRVIQRAFVPTRGASLKRPALIGAVLFASFSALCAGLLGAFLSRSYPSTGAVERTLELPVLVAAGRKPRTA